MFDRRDFLTGATAVGAVAMVGLVPLRAALQGNAAGARDFDFLAGDWQVSHRLLLRSAAGLQWAEGKGVCRHRPFEGGWGNVEQYVTRTPKGTNEAVGLRAFDPTTGLWSIWWLDGRYPAGPVGPATVGRFVDGVGTFLVDLTIDEQPMRQRYLWSDITARSARWEQAYSTDAGRTWETNWTMAFRRSEA